MTPSYKTLGPFQLSTYLTTYIFKNAVFKLNHILRFYIVINFVVKASIDYKYCNRKSRTENKRKLENRIHTRNMDTYKRGSFDVIRNIVKTPGEPNMLTLDIGICRRLEGMHLLLSHFIVFITL